MSADEYPKWDYKEYPKTLPPDDLWGQVRRTVYGRPVDEEQIQMMADAICSGLDLQPADLVLDIGCGNAALITRLFPFFGGCLGVDSSEYLISVANSRFASPAHRFVCDDAVNYVENEPSPLRFNKVLCFGMFAYLSDTEGLQLLVQLSERFLNVTRIYIGSLPDPQRAASFFSADDLVKADLSNPQSQIGSWRSQTQIDAMARAAGWYVRHEQMPSKFYQAHYRYNAILERPI